MQHQRKNILITRPLSKQQREYAHSLGLSPIEKPALKFEFPENRDHVLKIINKNPQSSWIFTSKNGVKGLKKLIDSGLNLHHEKQIFAVGSKTQKALQKLGLKAKIPFHENASGLADLIIEERAVDSVIYFHGNLSRNELTNNLAKNDIEVIDIEVYKTNIRPVELPSEPVEAILFYSPSAVEGFKHGQGFAEPLPPLFAIGPTTAETLENETDQPINIADKSNTEVLLQTVSKCLLHEAEVK